MFILCCCTFFDSWICGFVALGLVFPCQATRLAWGTSLKWPILCRVGRKTTTQSINQSVSTYFRPLRQIRSCSNHQTVTRMNWFKLYTLHVTRKSPKTDRCCDGWSECSLFRTSPGCGSHQHPGNTVRWRNPGRCSRDGLHGLVCDRHSHRFSSLSGRGSKPPAEYIRRQCGCRSPFSRRAAPPTTGSIMLMLQSMT